MGQLLSEPGVFYCLLLRTSSSFGDLGGFAILNRGFALTELGSSRMMGDSNFSIPLYGLKLSLGLTRSLSDPLWILHNCLALSASAAKTCTTFAYWFLPIVIIFRFFERSEITYRLYWELPAKGRVTWTQKIRGCPPQEGCQRSVFRSGWKPRVLISQRQSTSDGACSWGRSLPVGTWTSPWRGRPRRSYQHPTFEKKEALAFHR